VRKGECVRVCVCGRLIHDEHSEWIGNVCTLMFARQTSLSVIPTSLARVSRSTSSSDGIPEARRTMHWGVGQGAWRGRYR